MTKTRYGNRKGRKKRFWKITIMTCFLLIFGASSFMAYSVLTTAKNASDQIYQEIDRERIPTHRDNEVKISNEAFTVLIAGIDEQGGGKRTDVLMLATINPLTEEAVLLSIPRDTRTYIPDLGYSTKINHSYGAGGIEATISAINELIDVPIDYYITTNFQGFEDIVDTLGGVTIDVPFTFKSQLTGSLKWKTFNEGKMTLNGNEALAYVRMRKNDPRGDHGRSERQQDVIKSIVDKGSSISTITKINDILNDIGDNVRTNIPVTKFVGFAQLYTKFKDVDIENLAINGKDEYINDIYYYIPDDESLDEVNTIISGTLDKEKVVSNKTGYPVDGS